MNLSRKGKYTLSIFLDKVFEHSQHNPDFNILFDSDRSWSWVELLSKAYEYGKLFQSMEIDAHCTAIPILTSRSGECIAAILGAMLSGLAFAPLNRNQPNSRLESCMGALGANFVINPSRNLIKTKWERVMTPDEDVLNVFGRNKSFAAHFSGKHLGPDDNLYVLFTSGSTGKPKGVIATHSNILNTVEWSRSLIDWLETDVIGCCTDFSFDISMFDLFSSIFANIPIVILSNPKNVDVTLDEINTHNVSSIFGVPTFFSSISQGETLADGRLKNLRRILSGGDFFPPAHVLRWVQKRPDIDVFNVWGPTETSIVNTMHRVNSSDVEKLTVGGPLSVGRAHPRMEILLIDETDGPFNSPNKHGEICMLGECVTRGYIGTSEIEKSPYTEFFGKRCFKTSDIGFFDENQDLFIVGRKGTTVKIAGFRIDLVEVEAAATKLKGIKNACAFVLKTQNPAIRSLAIVVELKDGQNEFDLFHFKSSLRTLLPKYMVPKKVIVSDNLPTNINGKIDRKKVVEQNSAA